MNSDFVLIPYPVINYIFNFTVKDCRIPFGGGSNKSAE